MSEQEGKNENVTKTTAKEDKKTSLAREIWEWVYTLAIAIVIAMLIKGFIFDIVRVDGSSMFPTLVDNDRLIVTKLRATLRNKVILSFLTVNTKTVKNTLTDWLNQKTKKNFLHLKNSLHKAVCLQILRKSIMLRE